LFWLMVIVVATVFMPVPMREIPARQTAPPPAPATSASLEP